MMNTTEYTILNEVFGELSDFRKAIVSYECNKTLTVVHVNASSCARDSSFDEIKVLIDECEGDVDIIVISETWFKHNELCLYELKGYECVHSCRKFQRGGGLSMYVKRPCEITDKVVIETELNIVKLKLKNYMGVNNLCVIGVYRPPGSRNFNNFLVTLQNNLNDTTGDDVILTGDMNVNLNMQVNNDNKEPIERYKNLLCSMGMVQYNYNTTREASGTPIDHFFTNMTERRRHRIATIKCDFSDHNIIVATIESPQRCEGEVTVNKIDYSKLADMVKQNIHNVPTNTSDPNVQYDALSEVILNATTQSRRTKTVRSKKYKQCEWIERCPNILRLIRQKKIFGASIKEKSKRIHAVKM